MYQIKTRRVIGKPPAQLPPGWELYNAPRPLFGSLDNDQTYPGGGSYTWQGDFISGVFYAAVNPDDPEADTWREENRRLAADRLEFIDRADVVKEMVEYYQRRFADRPEKFNEIFDNYPLDDPETHRLLIDTWYNLEMNWRE